MRIDILSLFPEYFSGPFDASILKRARDNGLLDIRLTDIRDYTHDKHRTVDDRPYGGGPGMVMMAHPVAEAIRDKKTDAAKVVYMSPQGRPLTAERAAEFATEEHLVVLCGHYEGIDQRVLDSEIDEEVSIGDYVLTNGCAAAIVFVDALARFIPGVLGHEDAAAEDSFENGLLDCPHYTRPESFEGKAVPQVLLQGNHRLIQEWRHQAAVAKTRKVRPELYEKLQTKCS